MRFLKIMLFIMLVSCMATFMYAQGKGMGQGLNRDSVSSNNAVNIKLDVNNPIMFDGNITKIETVKLWNYSRGGIQLSVKYKTGISSVIQMGPEFYFVEQKILFKTGDQIKGIAYKGEYNKKLYLFAINIEINGKKITLRDKNGFAIWRNSLRNRRGNRQGKRNW